MTEFIPGLKLSEAFYHEAVLPILNANFPGLRHSAALIGYGSDVMGFDTPISRDHMWGPRVVLFLSEEGFDATRAAVMETLRHNLPVTFRGYSTHFGSPDPRDNGVRVAETVERGPVDPLIFIHTIADFWQSELGADPSRQPTAAEWLSFPQQQLIAVTAGKVFHDDLGLEQARARFAYYPHDLWLYLLAAQWSLIAEIQAFPGRAYSAGDELGSRIIATRIADLLIHLCFLMEKRYAPYAKWTGTAFARLDCAPRMAPLLAGILAGQDYPTREPFLARAYTLAAEMHNALGVTPPLDPRTRTYAAWHQLRNAPDLPYDYQGTRPHQVIFADRFTDALREAIRDPEVLALPTNRGSVDQFLVESSMALFDADLRRRIFHHKDTKEE